MNYIFNLFIVLLAVDLLSLARRLRAVNKLDPTSAE